MRGWIRWAAAAVGLAALGLTLGYFVVRIPEPAVPLDADGCHSGSGVPALSTFLLAWLAFGLMCAGAYCLVRAWPPTMPGRIVVGLLGVVMCLALYIGAQAPIQVHGDAIPQPRHCPL